MSQDNLGTDLGKEHFATVGALELVLLLVNCGDVQLQVVLIVEPFVTDVALRMLVSVDFHVLHHVAPRATGGQFSYYLKGMFLNNR